MWVCLQSVLRAFCLEPFVRSECASGSWVGCRCTCLSELKADWWTAQLYTAQVRMSSTRVSTNVVYIREDTIEQPTRLGFAISLLISTNCPHLLSHDDWSSHSGDVDEFHSTASTLLFLGHLDWCTAVRDLGTVSSLQHSADNSLHDLFAPLEHVNLMPHVDDSGLVSRALVVHPPRRRKRQTSSMHPWASPPMLLELPSEVIPLLLPGHVLILAQETLLRHRQPEPSVAHVCTITSLEVVLTPQSHSSDPYQLPPPPAIPTPSVHTKRPQLCYSMLSCSAPCRNSALVDAIRRGR